jgi:hypothetical protein
MRFYEYSYIKRRDQNITSRIHFRQKMRRSFLLAVLVTKQIPQIANRASEVPTYVNRKFVSWI